MPVQSPRLYFSIVVVALLTSVTPAFADSPNVTAVLSNSEAAVGETVQLQVKVTGSRGARAPEEISVDGLEIHRTGTEQRVEMNNFNMSSSVIYNYTILPMKAGTFKIPPQTIDVGGNSLRTPGLTLHVSDTGSSGTANAPRQPSIGGRRQPVNIERYGFLELVVPKREAYVGEIVPVEIKLGLNAEVRFQDIDFPDLNIQGVTLEKAQKTNESLETVNGATYHVLTLKGALAAIRPGKLEIPELEADEVALVPRSRPNSSTQRRSPFDVFPDPFDDPFFSDALRGLRGEPVKIPIKSQPITLDIKPLPANAPTNFSGAVGTFTMNVEAKPKSVQVGDPITITAAVAGRGNFDRLSAPPLDDERGWHKYPSSGKFVRNDDVGISGTKTFEMVISPNEKKSTIPPLLFSYFDPLKEEYVTVRSDAISIKVEGGTIAAAPTPANAAVVAAAPQPGATAKPQDILYQLTDGGRVQSFAPLYTQPVFWLAQLVPLAGLLGFAGWRFRQTKINDQEIQRLAALQHESAQILRQLRRKDLSPEEYFGQAARVVRIKTALVQKVDPNSVDAESAANAFNLDPESREQLRQLFNHNDELRYSGASNGSSVISASNRREVLELIERLHT